MGRGGSSPEIPAEKPRGMLRMMQRTQGEGAADDEPVGEPVETLQMSDTPFQLGRLLSGQLVRWKETRQSVIYRSKDNKVIRGETIREFDVVYLRPCKKPKDQKPPALGGHLCRLVLVSCEIPG